MTNERLQQIANTPRTMTAFTYGHDPVTYEPLIVTGEEVDVLIHELIRLRIRIGNLETQAFEGSR